MGVAEDVEVFFPVGVVVGVVGADALVWEVLFGGLVEAGGEGVGLGLAFAGVAAPACGVHPLRAIAGGVDVNADEDYVGMPGRCRA